MATEGGRPVIARLAEINAKADRTRIFLNSQIEEIPPNGGRRMMNPKIGSCVILHKDGEQFPAIVVNKFGGATRPMVSVAYAAREGSAPGMYGREIIYETSLNHTDDEKNGNPCWSDIITPAHGNFYMALDPHIVASNYEGP